MASPIGWFYIVAVLVIWLPLSQAACSATICSTGYFYNDLSSSCELCPIGQSCPGGLCSSSYACPTGTYALGGASICTSCDPGYYCPDPTANPIACSPGTYQSLGTNATSCEPCPYGSFVNQSAATGCSPCPAGFSCVNPGNTPKMCSAGTYSAQYDVICSSCASGTYSLSGATGCSACPPGQSCLDPAASPIDCLEGFVSSGGVVTTCSACPNGTSASSTKSTCDPCPAGFDCTDPTNVVACPDGTYNDGSGSCINCPAGSFCPAPYTHSYLCPSGTYSNGGQFNCTVCPAGYSCSDGINTVACNPGEYSLEGQMTCSTCQAGYKCPTPDVAPILCADGEYSAGGSTICETCPAGFACPNKALSPTICNADEYAFGGGQTSCSVCPAGFECLNITAAPSACPSGYYSLDGSTTCTQCPGGYSCANPDIAPVPCFTGTYSAAGSISCTVCPKGEFCANQTTVGSVSCAPGTYSIGGQESCTVCPAGSRCPYTDQAVEIACTPGTYSSSGQVSCTTCPAGYECPSGSTNATQCPSGSYSGPGQETCLVCPAGYECTVDSAIITPCIDGWYSLASEMSCTGCPAGERCPLKDSAGYLCLSGTFSYGNSTFCQTCPEGYQCPSALGTSISICPSGSYRTNAVTAGSPQALCIQCPAGSYCPDVYSEPIGCPLGFFSGPQATSCTKCWAGHACPIVISPGVAGATSPPTECTAGTYAHPGSIVCTACESGYLCGTASNSSAPAGNECPIGYYCPEGATTGTACPAGTYRDTVGAKSITDCLVCPVNKYCVAGNVNPYPQNCTSGYYCPEGTSTANQHPCPAGTYMPSSVDLSLRRQISDCLLCPEGKYCPSGTSIPIDCPEGQFCPAGSTSSGDSCPRGTYSDFLGATDVGNCTVCPTGSYCPEFSDSPIPCPAGTFNPDLSVVERMACKPCTAGFACPSSGLSAATTECSRGHYCPTGTSFPNENPCPEGTYTNSTNLVNWDQCTPCPAGQACDWGTTGPGADNPPLACAAGHYCPEGTSLPTQYPCPAGTYTTSTSLTSVSQCTQCPPGSYCEGGQGFISGSCSPGYFCPAGSNTTAKLPCPAGTWTDRTNATAASDCFACPTGHYCPEGSSSFTNCPNGTYANQTNTEARGYEAGYSSNSQFPSCVTCPEGHACGLGTVQPTKCVPGEYTPYGVDACLPCPAGYYCDVDGTGETFMLASKRCPAGTYCAEGTVTAATPCSAGHYCPEASATEIPCAPGTYTNGGTGFGSCLDCPAGSYCLEGASTASGECDPGFYCPVNSIGARQKPCPGGTYRATTNATKAGDCDICPAGSSCPQGSNAPIICELGYYCPVASEYPVPCPSGTYADVLGTNSSVCKPCDPGRFCDTEGLSAPTGLCSPGYYCVGGANTSQPTGAAFGGFLCSAGGYCPEGSSEPTACPAGTYMNVTGASSLENCILCDAGYYCANTNLPGPTGECLGGFYCTGGATNPRQFWVDPGYYSYAAAVGQTPCPFGTYQPGPNATECFSCPAGKYCPESGTSTPTECPRGAYCPRGSSTFTSCPVGTYSNGLNEPNATTCLDCPGGQYCDEGQLPLPKGNCSRGYYCSGGSRMKEPAYVSFGDICPAGSYCPIGTTNPIPCPLGTYQPTTGAYSSSDCLTCPAKRYCDSTPISAYVGDCAQGYYCPAGSTSSMEIVCPAGSYCPASVSSPIPCDPGTYSNRTGLAGCDICPAGYYCGYNAEQPVPCPEGSYCELGSTTVVPSCPAGTFGNRTHMEAVTDCYDCSPGKYCNGGKGTSGSCAASYYCPGSAIDNQGRTSVSDPALICTQGHYCPEGSNAPIECPIGTYSSATGLNNVDGCFNCTAGYYCDTAGTVTPVNECQAGYYCLGGSTTATPTDGIVGDICPIGNYCPQKSAFYQPCIAGDYQDATTQSSCDPCLEGFYCPQGTGSLVANICPEGYYCPASTQSMNQYPCPIGTFSNLTQRTSPGACYDCPAGQYCDIPGLSTPRGPCQAGYYCLGAAQSDVPVDGTTGNICSAGNYCPEGSGAEVPCDAGKYCATNGLGSPSNDCTAGYYCSGGSDTPTPTNGIHGDICPAGSYCVAGTPSPQACPAGTFTTAIGSQDITACVNCTAGFYCNSTGLDTTSEMVPCTEGYYCEVGTVNPYLECPPGYYCPAGASQPEPCPARTYQDQTKATSCKECPSGYFCAGLANSDFSSSPCPAGSYCLNSTATPTEYLCPIGTFQNITHADSINDCHSCTPGYYCASQGLDKPTDLCAPGYYCGGGGATTPIPNDEVNSNTICPAGSYCPAGSVTPLPCPAGTFSNSPGAQNTTSCLPCEAGKYCVITNGQNNATNCAAGYVCFGGATTATPNDATGRPCLAGTYCTAGSTVELNCDEGSYNPNTGQSECQPCLEGYYCDDSGMSTLKDCPAGFYCPPGTSIPTAYPCPIGTYSTRSRLTNATECDLCPAGYYCNALNQTGPTAQCDPGYICSSGATRPDPIYDAVLENGPCPEGAYCLIGSTSPTLCNPGTYNPSMFADEASDCIACTQGYYCDTLGLNSTAGECQQGYYCPTGSSVATQIECTAGHYCPTGSVVPTPCQDTTYQPDTAQFGCINCPSDYYCRDNATNPIECPLNYYCPALTDYPILCPNGTYGLTAPISTPGQCTPCPAGKYCRSGVQQGDCAAGWWCKVGMQVANPSSIDQTDKVGGPCPAGHYCPAGTLTPIPCVNGTLRETEGASMETECLPCPTGYECLEGDPTPIPCPVGGYCLEEGIQTPCLPGTYSGAIAAVNQSTCEPCPAGYFCSDSGISDYTQYVCPETFYCPEQTLTPRLCPAGTINNQVGGTDLSSCLDCPEGYYCEAGANYSLPCYGGTYCPLGSVEPRNCTAGNYCPPLSGSQLTCPAGFYCPSGSSTYLDCPIGTYCVAGSYYPTDCPQGYVGTSDRTSFSAACESCSAGYYASNETTSRACLLCDPGYVCNTGAFLPDPTDVASENGYICPAGAYCPAGATAPSYCAAGTYQPNTGASDLSACIPCPAGFFSSSSGSTGCTACASTATSEEGGTFCSCVGKNRAFQPSDQTCLCKPTFEHIVDGEKLEETDGEEDCQAIVYDRCETGFVRDSDGECVDKDTGDCEKRCDGGPGTFSIALGFCECADAPLLDDVCDSDCRSTRPTFTYSDGVITVTDPSANATWNIDPATHSRFIDSSQCPSGQTCNIYPMIVDNGVGGTYGIPDTLDTGFASRRRRLLATSGAVNPAIICLELNEGIFFDVSQGSYPEYQKDNLLNDNPDFDYGYFRTLAIAAANSTAVQAFIYTFTDAGVHVFADNTNADKWTIIKVVGASEVCPSDDNILPSTISNLVSLGVTQNDDLVQTPDWTLIAILLALLFFLVTLILIELWYFNRRAWSLSKPKQPEYKKISLDDSHDLWQLHSKGSVPSVESLTEGVKMLDELPLGGNNAAYIAECKAAVQELSNKVTAWENGEVKYLPDADSDLGDRGQSEGDEWMNELSADFDLEGFDFNALYQMMTETKMGLDNYYVQLESDRDAFYTRMDAELHNIQTVLFIKTHVQLNERQEGFVDALERLVMAEIEARGAFRVVIKQRFSGCSRVLADLANQIALISDIDYNTFPIKELTRNVLEIVEQITTATRAEYKRRQNLANQTEIIGNDIVAAFTQLDDWERDRIEEYLRGVTAFQAEASRELSIMERIETQFAKDWERLQHADQKKKERATDEYHRAIVDQLQKILVLQHHLNHEQVMKFESDEADGNEFHRKWLQTMYLIAGEYLEQRRHQIEESGSEGAIFRGINPELSKVLSGLLGSVDGIRIDPKTGKYEGLKQFDEADPFETILHPEFMPDDWNKPEPKKKKKKKSDPTKNLELPPIPPELEDEIAVYTKKMKLKIDQLETAREEVENNPDLDEEAKHRLFVKLDMEREGILANYVREVTLRVNQWENEEAARLAKIEEDNAAVREAEAALAAKNEEMERLRAQQEAELQELQAQMELDELEGDGKDGGFFDLESEEVHALLDEFEVDVNELRRMTDEQRAKKLKQLRKRQRHAQKQARLNELRARQAEALAALERGQEQMILSLEEQRRLQEQMQQMLLEASSKAKEEIREGKDALLDPENLTPALQKLDAEHKKRLDEVKQDIIRLALIEEGKLVVFEAMERARIELMQDQKRATTLQVKKVQLVDLQRVLAELKRKPAALRGMTSEHKIEKSIKTAEEEIAQLKNVLEKEDAALEDRLQERLEKRKNMGKLAAESAAALALKKEEALYHTEHEPHYRPVEVKALGNAQTELPEDERRGMTKKLIEITLSDEQQNATQAQLTTQFQERDAMFNKLLAEWDEPEFEAIEKEVARLLDEKHALEAEDLRIKHQEQVKEIFKELYPDEKFDGEEWQTDENEDALTKFRQDRIALVDKQMKEEREKQEAEWKKQEEDAAAEHEQKMKEAQEEYERHYALAEKRAQERYEIGRQALESYLVNQRMQLEMDMEGREESERQDALRQHQLNLQKKEKALNDERLRQREKFMTDLARNRRRRAQILQRKRLDEERERKKARDKKLAELVKEKERRRAARAAEMQAKKAVVQAQDAAVLGMKPPADSKREGEGKSALDSLGLSSVGEGSESSAQSERAKKERKIAAKKKQDEIDAKHLTPAEKERKKVLSQMSRIEQLMNALSEEATSYRDQSYCDRRDKEDPDFKPLSGKDADAPPVVMKLAEMDARGFVLYRFSTALIEKLTQAGYITAPDNIKGPGPSPVKLLIAHQIPPNAHQSTAYRNSFFYLKNINTLFIRRQRMQNVGEFVLVLVHCLSHISTSGRSHEWDDRNPKFLETFYRCMGLCTSELFYSRSAEALNLLQPGLQVEGKSHSQEAKELRLLAEVREVGVADLIDLHPLSSEGTIPGDVLNGSCVDNSQFASSKMIHRMEEYDAFHSSASIRKHLLELEEAAARRDHTREQRQRTSYQRRNKKGANASRLRAMDKEVWKGNLPRDQAPDTVVLENVADILNADMVEVVDAMYHLSVKLQQLQGEMESGNTEEFKGHDLQPQIDAIHAKLNELALQKDGLVQRLRNVEEATAGLQP